MTQSPELAISTLNRLREELVKTVEGILSKPSMWGQADACEAYFLQSLELLHIIDYPNCINRCGWNCHVNYIGRKYQSSSSLSFLVFTQTSDKNWLRVAEEMKPDLENIWFSFKQTHPHLR